MYRMVVICRLFPDRLRASTVTKKAKIRGAASAMAAIRADAASTPI